MDTRNTQRLMFILSLMIASVVFAEPPSNLSLKGVVDWVTTWGHVASGTGALPAVGPVGERYTDLTIATAPVDYRSDGIAWQQISGGGNGTTDHSALNNLDFSGSGHTGFASAGAIAAVNGRIDSLPAGIATHSALGNLDFNSSGHTGFASAGAIAETNDTIAAMLASDSADRASMTVALASASALTSQANTTNASLSAHMADQIDPHGATQTISQELTLGSGTPDAFIERSGPGLITIASWARILPSVASPTSAATGTLWMDISTAPAKLRCFDGSTWQALW